MLRRRRHHNNISIARFLVLCGIALVLLSYNICNAAEDGNDGSANSGDNQKDDDVIYDEIEDGEYSALYDDPYMPTDDAVLQELNAEIEAEEWEALNSAKDSTGRDEVYKILRHVAAASAALLGLASAIFCTSIFLYFVRVQYLMRRYSSEGVVVDGRILASYPDIEEAIKKADADFKRWDTPDTSKVNHDSYSMMTDDGSYQNLSRSEYSGSDRSGEKDVEQGQKGDHNVKEKEQTQPVEGGVSLAGGSTTTSAARSRQQISDTKGRRKFLSRRFRVIVEYDDITYHDEINQESSEIIRKGLLIKGEDVEETNNNTSDLLVKLRVLKDKPLSGYPCGEVARARRWQRMLSFNLHLVLGVAFVVGGSILAHHSFPATLFYMYIGLLLLQVPSLNCFLHGSFNELISKDYLESGLSRPSGMMNKGIDEEKMLSSLKNGTLIMIE